MCYSIVYHYNSPTGPLTDWALILLGLALCLLNASVSSNFMVLYTFVYFLVRFFTLFFNELCLVGLTLDLIN